MPFQIAYTFDDVLLAPHYSAVRPKQAELKSRVSKRIELELPFLSAPMDTVTESAMAIALALDGGMGIIHKNLSIERQVAEVEAVKRYENGFIARPVTLTPKDLVEDAVAIAAEKGYAKIPILNGKKLIGLLTDKEYFVPDDLHKKISEVMRPRKELITAKAGVSLREANKLIRKHRVSVIPVVDEKDQLVSLVTRKDIEKNELYPNASKDEQKRLRVGAAIGTSEESFQRALLLAEKNIDLLVVDTAHGHSDSVLAMIRRLKKDRRMKNVDIVGGNVATADGARALVAAGADAIKVGVGPGSICTTRIVSGVGVPQLTAIMEAAKVCRRAKVPVIGDGGIRFSGDIVKALAAGADTVMMGSLFAGTAEAPGDVEYYEGRMYKTYRGMGSLGAMKAGSKDRYFQADKKLTSKLVPEGVEGRILYKGPVTEHIYQLTGGLRSGFGYLGAKNIAQLRQHAKFYQITTAGMRESHVHDVKITKDAPNYAV